MPDSLDSLRQALRDLSPEDATTLTTELTDATLEAEREQKRAAAAAALEKIKKPHPHEEPPPPLPTLTGLDIVDLPAGAVRIGGPPVQLVTIATYSDGSQQPVGARYLGTAPAVGTVTETGELTPAATGSGGELGIVAEFEGKQRGETLTIENEPPRLASLFFYLEDPALPLPAERTLAIGGEETVRVGGLDQYGDLYPGPLTLVFAINDEALLDLEQADGAATVGALASGSASLLVRETSSPDQPTASLLYVVPVVEEPPPPPPPDPIPGDSATGRNPDLGFSRDWMRAQLAGRALAANPPANPTRRELMAIRFHQKNSRIATYPNYNSTPANPAGLYFNGHLANAVKYQWSNDSADAKSGLDFLRAQLGAPLSANRVREHTLQWAALYDWLYPAMTPSDRTAFAGELRRMADYILGDRGEFVGQQGKIVRATDSDQTVGPGLALYAIERIDTPETRAAGLYMNLSNQSVFVSRTAAGIVTVIPVGDLLANVEANLATIRNRVCFYLTVDAEGGEWIESAHYNPGTTSLVNFGVWLIQAKEPTAFPEHRPWVEASARYICHLITETLDRQGGWGDSETKDLHTRDASKWFVMLAERALMAKGTANGKLAQKLLERWFDELAGAIGLGGLNTKSEDATAATLERTLMMYPPLLAGLEAEPGPFPWTVAPSIAKAQGVGHVLVKNPGGSLITLHGYSALLEGLDHSRTGLSDVRILKNSQFPGNRPEGYGTASVSKLMQCDTLLAGLQQAFKTQDRVVLLEGETPAGIRFGGTVASERGPYDLRTYNQWPGCLGGRRRYQLGFWEPVSGAAVVVVYELIWDWMDPTKAKHPVTGLPVYPGNLNALAQSQIAAARDRTGGIMIEQQWWPYEHGLAIAGNRVDWLTPPGTYRGRLDFLAPAVTINHYPAKQWVTDNGAFPLSEAVGVRCLRATPAGGFSLDEAGFLNPVTVELATVEQALDAGVEPLPAVLVDGAPNVIAVGGHAFRFLDHAPWIEPVLT